MGKKKKSKSKKSKGKKSKDKKKHLTKKAAAKQKKSDKKRKKKEAKKKAAPSKLKSITARPKKASAPMKALKSSAKPAPIGRGGKVKIDDLFAYRLLPWLLSLSNIKAPSAFLRKLKALQTKIYLLDHYLETNWNLEEKELAAFWEAIYRNLEAFDLSREEAVQMVKQIERYQSHEISMRDDKSPTRFTIRHFYYYKSCDVKLMRTLIYRADPNLEKIVRKTDWTDFDLITEVNDDITDLQEDMKIYNANRFMFQLIETGKTATGKAFRSFISEIRTSSQKRFEKNQTDQAQYIKKSTQTAIKQTLAMLRAQLSAADLVEIRLAKSFT